MSWLKLDDGYDTHPKLLALTEVQRWRWTRVLLACARHRSDIVSLAVLREVNLHKAVETLVRVGLLEPTAVDEWRVHKFNAWNGGTVEERVYGYLDAVADASANEVWRVVGGRRADVLAAVDRYRAGTANGSAVPPHLSTEVVPDRFPPGTPEPSQVVPAPRARARGSRPVPYEERRQAEPAEFSTLTDSITDVLAAATIDPEGGTP